MPTPNDDVAQAPRTIYDPPNPIHLWPSHSTCPPEDLREATSGQRPQLDLDESNDVAIEDDAPADDASPADTTASSLLQDESMSPTTAAADQDAASDTSADSLSQNLHMVDVRRIKSSHSDSPIAPFANTDLHTTALPTFDDPSTTNNAPCYISSFLRSGSKFEGTQQSDKQTYNVQVEVKHVDMSESFICGFLKIEGLTADHPTLTTYFEGEIIGNKYSFITRHPEWGSTEKMDLTHWRRFEAFGPLHKAAKKSGFSYKKFYDQEHIFMRWKEYFLVPDHRVRTISGASFEGFYYICFNQAKGTVEGIYFHSRSERFQHLELKHVDDRGCCGAVQLR